MSASETTSQPQSQSQSMFARLGPMFLANPYAVYSALHASNPVMWSPEVFGIGAWIVTSHAVASAVLRGKQFGKEGHKVLPPEKLAKIPQETVELAERRRNNMLFRDPPDHTRLRGLVTQAFTPRMIERLRLHIAELTEKLCDDIEKKGSADLIADVAFPLPITVIAELLGVPPSDRDQFKAWSTELTVGLSPAATAEEVKGVIVAAKAMDVYMRDVAQERRQHPRADLISELVRVQSEGDRLSLDELSATCRVILTAGHETTVNLIGNGMLALLRHPEERAQLAADPSLLPGAIEELLRYDSPVQMTMRFAYEDATLGGQTIKRGDPVALILGAANRDPEQYSDPERLDIRRENAHTHLSFGLGCHYCLGAALARTEGVIAVGALLRRFPKLALTAEPLTYRPNIVLRGLKSLPVTLS